MKKANSSDRFHRNNPKSNPVNPVILSKFFVFRGGTERKTFDRITGFTGLRKDARLA